MSDSMILGVGAAVFALVVIGVVLTILEFRANVYPAKRNEESKPLQH